jgi:hypothetical protein
VESSTIAIVLAIVAIVVIVVAVRSGVGQDAGSFPFSNRHDKDGPGPGGIGGVGGLGGPGGGTPGGG